MKKWGLISIFMFLSSIAYSGYSGDGTGLHKACKHLDMHEYDIHVTSINAKGISGLHLLNSSKTSGMSIKNGTANIDNLEANTSLKVGGVDVLTSYSENDPNFNGWDKSSGIVIAEVQVSDLTHFTTNNLETFISEYSILVETSSCEILNLPYFTSRTFVVEVTET